MSKPNNNNSLSALVNSGPIAERSSEWRSQVADDYGPTTAMLTPPLAGTLALGGFASGGPIGGMLGAALGVAVAWGAGSFFD